MNSGKSKRIIAMWSGPRNLSTAMMRSFGSRPDCTVMDEPFYAAYLKATGLKHPMHEEVIADGETDPQLVIEQCLAPPPDGTDLVYQKHMTHHMIDEFETDWISKVTNVFLIREPRKVLASYAAKTEAVTAEDIGFHKQAELFRFVRQSTGATPAVIDAHDIRLNPETALKNLCAAIDIPFSEAMLSWESGPRAEDGIWASHWYDAVWKSTGFAPPEDAAQTDLPDHLAEIEAQVLPEYVFMRGFCSST